MRSEQATFTAIVSRVNGWYIGTAVEIPGVNSQAKTLLKLRKNLVEAAQLVIETNRKFAEQEASGEKSKPKRVKFKVNIPA